MESRIFPALQLLHDDFQVIGSFVREFSGHVIADEISEYPVYVAFQDHSPFGKPFLNSQEHKLNWNYNASVLEEFVRSGLIPKERVEDFTSTFADPLEKACVFLIAEAEASFVFVPVGGK